MSICSLTCWVATHPSAQNRCASSQMRLCIRSASSRRQEEVVSELFLHLSVKLQTDVVYRVISELTAQYSPEKIRSALDYQARRGFQVSRRKNGVQRPRKPEKLPETKKLRPQQPPGTCWMPGLWRYNPRENRYIWDAGYWSPIESPQGPPLPDARDPESEFVRDYGYKKLAEFLEACEHVCRFFVENREVLLMACKDDPQMYATVTQLCENAVHFPRMPKSHTR